MPKGCYDSKVTSWGLARNMSARVVGGPTTSHGQPPFSWTSDPAWTGFKHRGMPDGPYTFEFETMSPEHLPFEGVACGQAAGMAAS